MAVWYKAALSGTYQGQAIVNILYYGDDAGDGVLVWNPAVAADLGVGIVTDIVPAYLTLLPTTYTLNSVVVTGVNERGVTVSDFEVEQAVGLLGGNATATEGQAQTSIIAFQTIRQQQAERNIKRSYLAYGPLADNQQASDGSLEASFATGIVPLLAALQTNVQGPLQEYAPVRIGRTVAPALIAIGRVNGVTLRPFASFRKSRKRRPTGL